MQHADIGVIGLSVMGANLAQNFESRGFTVSVFNRTAEKTTDFMEKVKNRNFIASQSLSEFVSTLSTPRKILLMVKAGSAVDELVDQLLPLIEPGDILIDGGNSEFVDTARRVSKVESDQKLFVGMGVSGGEEGALHGPSLMPGGSTAAWPIIQPLCEKIAAKVGSEQTPCVTWIGEGGAGHFVKMVHNGIEYADMQLISEGYALMRDILKLPATQMQQIFEKWNQGRLKSYLIEITAKILSKKDDQTSEYLLEKISDAAAQKGTGKWTAQVALDLGVPIPTISEAVNRRFLSSFKAERQEAANILHLPTTQFAGDVEKALNDLEAALYISKITAYAQGFALMQEAAKKYGWKLDFSNIANIWRGGCIIRAELLEKIATSFADSQAQNLLLQPDFAKEIVTEFKKFQSTLELGIRHGAPFPGMNSAFTYITTLSNTKLPTNLIQAQRDFFGAHTYHRTDRDGTFHTDWEA